MKLPAGLRVPAPVRRARLRPPWTGETTVEVPAEILAEEIEEIVAGHLLATRRCVTGGERAAARLAASIALQIPRPSP